MAQLSIELRWKLAGSGQSNLLDRRPHVVYLAQQFATWRLGHGFHRVVGGPLLWEEGGPMPPMGESVNEEAAVKAARRPA